MKLPPGNNEATTQQIDDHEGAILTVMSYFTEAEPSSRG
jgi:hypothetical protein